MEVVRHVSSGSISNKADYTRRRVRMQAVDPASVRAPPPMNDLAHTFASRSFYYRGKADFLDPSGVRGERDGSLRPGEQFRDVRRPGIERGPSCLPKHLRSGFLAGLAEIHHTSVFEQGEEVDVP